MYLKTISFKIKWVAQLLCNQCREILVLYFLLFERLVLDLKVYFYANHNYISTKASFFVWCWNVHLKSILTSSILKTLCKTLKCLVITLKEEKSPATKLHTGFITRKIGYWNSLLFWNKKKAEKPLFTIELNKFLKFYFFDKISLVDFFVKNSPSYS